MKIRDFMEMALEEDEVLVEIYNCDTSETMVKDFYCNIKDDYEDFEICSWNTIADFGICFNITEE